MRATLDFHGFSGGFTTVRQFLSRCWSSSEMLQGVEKEGLHMRFVARGEWACGECLLRVVVLNRWVSKVQMCSMLLSILAPLPVLPTYLLNGEVISSESFLPYRLAVLVSSWCRCGSGVNNESVSEQV
ncbi:unnamed protein product [Brassica napus]|uniref:(rape) hypothetical protein n=1 Tax=Brassica napus TaxID=3708 RepID=A0A817A8Q1_BRANA|nr:unnamed protein product [Brassica napus]